jgi:hypothetical protein
MLANDAVEGALISPSVVVGSDLDFAVDVSLPQFPARSHVSTDQLGADRTTTLPDVFVSSDIVTLSDLDVALLEHFVRHLSLWIDITDPQRSFETLVPSMALRNQGLLSAILALSSRHASLDSSFRPHTIPLEMPRTTAVEHYNATLRYLQHAMRDALYLRSDELLATVLIISTYEMIDGFGRGWERHLKGVFWIQRSQTIHGESNGLKKAIWWAWLRQDLWVAFKERRKILSYYRLARPCAELDFWELVSKSSGEVYARFRLIADILRADRSVYLLGQSVNFASRAETDAGQVDVHARVAKGNGLWNDLEEWHSFFTKHERRLPVAARQKGTVPAIWINPSAASLAMQVHAFSRLLLLENMPALGGMKEILQRRQQFEKARNAMIGIAMCTVDPAAVLVSTMCLYAAGLHVEQPEEQALVVQLLQEHQQKTGWPSYDMAAELESHWSAGSG